MKFFLCSFVFSAAFLSFSSFAFASELPYPDIETYSENFEAVYQMQQMGIFSGFEDGTFGGDQELNRAQLAKVLVLSTGVTEDFVHEYAETYVSSDLAVFVDVDYEAWYGDYVLYAQDWGWIEGYPDGTFRPENSVNVVEAAKMVIESQYGEPDYEGENWYDGYLLQLLNTDVLGLSDQSEPGDTLSSDQAVSFSFSRDYVGTLDSALERADVAELLYRVNEVIYQYDAMPPEFLDYDPYLSSDDYGYSYDAIFEYAEDYYSFNLMEETLGFQLTGIPLGDFWMEDLRFYVENPSAAANGYVTYWRLLYPSESIYFGENGFADLLTVSVYDASYYDSMGEDPYAEADFTSGDYVYNINCGQEAPEDLETVRDELCSYPVSENLAFSEYVAVAEEDEGEDGDDDDGDEAADYTYGIGETGYGVYTDYIYDFYLRVPGEWERFDGSGTTAVSFLEPYDEEDEDDLEREGVSVWVESVEEGTTLEDYADTLLGDLYADPSISFTLEEQGTTTFGMYDYDAYRVSGLFSPDSESRTIYVFTLQDNVAYTLVYGWEIEKEETYEPIFEEVLDSFQFLADMVYTNRFL